MSSYIDLPEMQQDRPRWDGVTAKAALEGAVAAPIMAAFAPLGILSRPAVRRAFLALAILSIPLSIGNHIGNREYAAEFGSLYGFYISLTTLALAGLYLPLLAGRRATQAQPWPTAGKALMLYLLCGSLSVFAAEDATLALYEVFLFVELALLYFYIVRTVTTTEEALLIIRFVVIGVVIEGLVMVALLGGLAELGILSPWVRVTDDRLITASIIRELKLFGMTVRVDENVALEISRVGGTIGSANDVAAYLSMALLATVGAIAAPLGRRFRRLAVLGFALGTIGLIYTFSRGGWGALALGFAALAWAGLFRSLIARTSWRIRLLAGVGLIIAAISLYGAIRFRLTMDDRGSAAARGPLNRLAVLMIRDNPLMGVGADNFALAMQPYVTRGFSGEFLYTVHNRYLLIWAETGPIALAAYVWFFVATLMMGWRSWKRADPVLSPLALACTAALGAFTFHMFWEAFRGLSVLQMAIVLAALVAVIDRLTAERRMASMQMRPQVYEAYQS
jgi:hypothetical protein